MKIEKLFFAIYLIAAALACSGDDPTEAPGDGTDEPGELAMISLPGATFTMGSEARQNQGPLREITASPFSIADREITQAQFRSVMGENRSQWKGDTLPAGAVSWYDAIEFCNLLSEHNGLEPVYSYAANSPVSDTPMVQWNREANGYRLPTEAEWEYAARGGTTTDVFSGDLSTPPIGCNPDGALDDISWYCANAEDGGHPVGEKTANPFGLHDMMGNVWEWVWDYERGFVPEPYLPGPQTDPLGRDGNGVGARLLRGGSWFHQTSFTTAAARIGHIVNAHYTHVDFGFRIAGPPDAPAPRFPEDDGINPEVPPVTPDNGPLDMVAIPGGSYEMAAPGQPGRTVTVDGFSMTRTEITQGQYVAVMGQEKNYSLDIGSDLPIGNITWYDAVRFANALSQRDGLTEAYAIAEMQDRPGFQAPPEIVTLVPGANGYRLPTEAEWEYAARAGTTTDHYNGDRVAQGGSCQPDPQLEAIAWYCANSNGRFQPVGQKPANAFGLHDMIGNATEWVWDWFAEIQGDDLVNPIGPPLPGPAGRFRIIRGGSYLGALGLHSSGGRAGHIVNEYYAHVDIGIRLVRPAAAQ